MKETKVCAYARAPGTDFRVEAPAITTEAMLILFLFSTQHILQAVTQDEYDLRVLIMALPAPTAAFLSFPPLLSCSRTTFIHTKVAATQQPPYAPFFPF
jgi:hypothetical protein